MRDMMLFVIPFAGSVLTYCVGWRMGWTARKRFESEYD